jgi:hypothetical protein
MRLIIAKRNQYRYLENIEIELFEKSAPIGTAKLVRIFAYDCLLEEKCSLFYLLDQHSQLTYGCYAALYDENGFNRNVENLFPSALWPCNVLLINRIEIGFQYRGKGLGLIAIKKMVQRWKSDCGLTVIKPFPLQYEGGKAKGHENEFERDRRKLAKYYSQLGFIRIPGTDFYAMPTSGFNVSTRDWSSPPGQPRSARTPGAVTALVLCVNAPLALPAVLRTETVKLMPLEAETDKVSIRATAWIVTLMLVLLYPSGLDGRGNNEEHSD